MKKEQTIDSTPTICPEPSLKRLPWYLSFARVMLEQGCTSMSSTQIAKGVGVESFVVAKDLSYVRLAGRTRVGYDLKDLVSNLEDFLGFSRSHRAFLFGVGSLGASLLQDRGLEQFGLNIVAGFDTKYELSGTSLNRTPIHHISRFEELQKQLGVEIGVLTVPAAKAQEVADLMIEKGIRAIWNFTPCRIQAPGQIIVQDTSIYTHLSLIYRRLQISQES